MKKSIFTLLALLFAMITMLGQNETDSEGRKQGKWMKYYEDGKTVRYKGQFKDDVPYGKFVYYYPSGDVQTILEYEEEGVAISKTYFENGSLMAKGYYVDQQKNGTWWYFSIDKLILAKEVYENGLLEGKAYKFFPAEIGSQPTVLEEINYKGGVAQGAWTRYFKDGKTQIKGKYVDGLQDGECSWYTPSGKIEVVGYYKEGKKHGPWSSFESDTTVIQHYWYGVEIDQNTFDKYMEPIRAEQQGNN